MKKIEVRFPMACPLRYEDTTHAESYCQALDSVTKEEVGGQCTDDEKFPDWCPLLKENLIVQKKRHEDIVRNVRKRLIMNGKEELVFARQFRKLLENKTLGAGKWMDLAYQEGIKACGIIEALKPEALILLFTDIRKIMLEDAETIAGEFSGGKSWEEYCKDTKTIVDRIDKMIAELRKG